MGQASKPAVITAEENPLSGSRSYVFAKGPGEVLKTLNDAITKNLGNQSQFWGEINASFFESSWNALTSAYSEAAKSIYQNPSAHSRSYAKMMLWFGRFCYPDSNVNETLNYKFFTHNRSNDKAINGSLNEINAQSLLEHFAPGSNHDDWPNLVLTSNHALVKSHKDVSGIMKGVHALVRDSFDGTAKNTRNKVRLLERHDDSSDDVAKDTKPSILLSSVHNNHNAWVNGGTLLQRLHLLDELYSQEQRWEQKTTDEQGYEARQREREIAYLGKSDTAMSPASIRLAKLILTLIVTEPDKVHMPQRADFEQHWPDNLAALYNKQPLTLREDARDVMQHLKLVGYSKGGNILTDTLRYLTLDMQHNKLVQIQNGHPQPQPITPDEMKALLMNTGILAVNPGISPLSNHEKALGIRRLSVRNPDDWVTAHLFERHNIKHRDGTNDDIYEIHPTALVGNLGHDPEAALGNMDNRQKGYLTDAGEVQSDSAVFAEMKSRLQCFLASCHGRSGIKSMRKDEAGVIHLEFSAGASKDDTQQVIEKLEHKLTRERVNATIEYDWKQSCEIRISPANDNKALIAEKVGKALKTLEKDGATFVGHNVYQDLGVSPPERGRAAA